MDQALGLLSEIDSKTMGYTVLNHFEAQSGLPRSYAVIGVVVVYFVLIFLNVGGIGQLLSNIAGFVVPGYYSLIALETSRTDDDTKLLTYWVVFAFLNVVEFWSKAILYWIPFYWLFKTIFLLYIGIPSLGGAVAVYNAVIEPISKKILHGGDNIADDIGDMASGVSTGVEM